MKALVVKQFGKPSHMVIEERPIPQPLPGQTLVRMRAATLNQLSNTVRTGAVGTACVPLVLGNEGAGVVESSGTFEAGIAVAIYGAGELGITADGVQQEWVLVEDKRVFPLPENLSLEEGAAITVNYITAYQALNRVAKVLPGQTVLISGATGALGHALMQMTHALGAYPIALVSNATKAERALAAGAHQVVDLSSADASEQILSLTQGIGADLAMDPAGGPMLGYLIKHVRPLGAVVAIGFAGGVEASFDLVDLIVHEKRVLGYDLHLETDDATANALDQIQRLVLAGWLRPVVDSTVVLEDFEKGYERLASRNATGAVVLKL